MTESFANLVFSTSAPWGSLPNLASALEIVSIEVTTRPSEEEKKKIEDGEVTGNVGTMAYRSWF